MRGSLKAILSMVLIVTSAASHALEVKQGEQETAKNLQTDNKAIKSEIISLNQIYANLKFLSEELNLVRKAMGKPIPRKPLLQVSNAQAREILNQSRLLFEKTNRLAQEVTGSYEAEPKINGKNSVQQKTNQLLIAAIARIKHINKELKIADIARGQALYTNITETLVMNELLNVSYQLNELLYTKYSPSDVFEKVTLTINYSEPLLKYLDSNTRIPEQPSYIANKTPKSVYLRLRHCMSLLDEIAKLSNIKMLVVKNGKDDLNSVNSGDVNDLVNLILSEVIYLNSLLPKKAELIPAFYPGYKVPSDVFQRAGILLKQLKSIKEKVVNNRRWLR